MAVSAKPSRHRAELPHALGRARARALHAGGPAGAGSAAPEDPIGLPGAYPFTRGIHESMYRGRLWTMRQFAGFGTSEETNERFHYLLEHGQTGLSTAFDMPSLMGHDSDHARSLGEVGREGVAVDTLDDMQTLFGGIDLGEVSVSMTINAPAAIMLAFYVAAAEADPGHPGAARAPVGHDPGGHPQGVHRPEGVVLPDRPGDAPVRRHDRVVHAAGCRAGTRSRSPATTSARPARPPSRSSRSRSRTASPTSSRRSSAASTSTTSRRGCRSSSTPRSTSSRRSPSTAPRGGSGRASCARPSARRTRAPGRCASTPRPPASA